MDGEKCIRLLRMFLQVTRRAHVNEAMNVARHVMNVTEFLYQMPTDIYELALPNTQNT
jgi:hypothetical protein